MRIQQAVVLRIEELLIERSISINKLANESAIPPSTLKSIMYGKSKNTGIVTIIKICDGLSISINEFFDGEIFYSVEQEIG